MLTKIKYKIPHFKIINKFQKRNELYEELLTPQILEDICLKTTGQAKYIVDFDNDSPYNKGRLATLYYQDKITYISFSEEEIKGRNSSFQSFSTALTQYILEENPNKEICFYFLPTITGNYETPYFIFNYRLMKTAKVNFLNSDYLNNEITPFSSPEDIIVHKNISRTKNSGNRSTYITRSSNDKLQIFGKTYGASKYETANLCLALSEISDSEIELYEIEEGGLTKLPQTSKEAIESLGIVKIFTSNRTIEKAYYEENNSLRSKEYIYNLLEKLGDKKCAFCNCEIPQIIQGAHIWPVADIKKANHLTQDEKLSSALDGNNGLWLCQNHHKLLDVNILRISEDGNIKYKTSINQTNHDFIHSITLNNKLENKIITENFINYLNKRNKNIHETSYKYLTT